MSMSVYDLEAFVNRKLNELSDRIAELENRTLSLVRLGPQRMTPAQEKEKENQIAKAIMDIKEKIAEAKETPPPTDFSARVLANGSPVPEDESHKEITASGQQRDYVVLTPAERGKGFVRPFRDAYRHLKCGKITTMGRAIAETYAREPAFYSGTFFTTCSGHFLVGEDGEFVWYEMDGTTGPKVGT